MRGKIEASVWLYLMTLLYARMTFCGKGHISEADSKHEANTSSGKFNRRRDFVSHLPNVALRGKQIQLQASSDEKVEEIDEAVVRPATPAKPVADSLVEIFEENFPNKPQEGNFNRSPFVNKNSTLSFAKSKYLTPKVVFLHSSSGKAQVTEKIQKFTNAHASSSKSRIISRVSIPGKHGPFNSSVSSWPIRIPFRGNQLQTIASANQRNHGGIVKANKANLMDRARNGINQDERVVILHKPIISKVLDNNSSLIRTLSPSKGVIHSTPISLPPKNVRPTDFPEDASSEKTVTDNENIHVIKGSPKSVSPPSQLLSVKKMLPVTRKVENIQEEPEVFDGLTHKNIYKQTKTSHFLTKDGHASKAHNVSIGILPSTAKKVSFHKNLSEEGKSPHVNLKSETHSNHHMKPKLVHSNNVWANVKSNTSLHLKSGTGVDLLKIKPKDKFLVANHNVTRGKHVSWPIDVHQGRNDTSLNNTKLKGNFTFPINPAAKKHFDDLIKFFNSFNSSSNETSTEYSKLQQRLGKNFTSEAKVKMRHRIMEESLHKILKFIRQRKRPHPNGTGEEQGWKTEEPHLKHNLLLENETRLLEKGWSKIIKSKGFGSVKGSPLINSHPRLNHTKSWSTNNNLRISAGNTSDENLLQLMQNASQKELLRLEEDIINALSFARSWNLSKPNKNERPQQQYGTNFYHTEYSKKHQHRVHSDNYRQEHHKQGEPATKQKTQKKQLPKHLENTLEQTQLQIMRNASRKELLKLENDIINALNHARLINVTHPNEKQSLRKLNYINMTDKDELEKQDFHFKEGERPNSVILPPAPKTKYSPSRKISDTKASHFAIGDKAYHKRPSFVEVEVQDGTRNLPVHFDKDSPLNMDIESAAEGKLGSGVLEMTEFVDQAPDKEEILVTRWSAWSSCTQSCGNRAKRKRVQYECSSRAKVIRDCAVSGDQEETCVLKPCPVHGRFLSWSKWHTCSRSCGTRGLSVRTRSCTEPRYGGQSCFGTSVETRPCNRKHCPVNGGLGEWSKFGLCSKSCGSGVRMRHRECNKPVPRYGGTECDPKDLFQTKACSNIKCPAKTLKSLQVANVDPKTLCDFNPCEEVGCLYDPAAHCITDFECNPSFFNLNGEMLPKCKGIDSLYSKIPQVICSFNPCRSERCSEIRSHCLVDLKCKPVFIDVDIRTIPPQCQVHGTVRVDRLKGDQTWTKLSPVNIKQSSVSLASDVTPSFTQLWYPVTLAKRLGQFERMKGTSPYPTALARPLSAYSTAMAAVAGKHAVQPLEQRPVTEVFIEKHPGDNDDDFDDHDNDDDDDDDDDDDKADDDDDDDGNVHADLDDDK